MEPYYEDETCQIYHGDCREILPELPNVGLVFGDPPYGQNYAAWDKTVIRPADWLYAAIGKAPTVYVTPGNGQQWFYPQPNWTLCWFRPGSVQRAPGGQAFSHWEPVLVYGKHVAKVDAKQVAVQNGEHYAGAGSHDCPKPLGLLRWLIGTTDAETILDPFCGSGTTLRAAKDEGRRAIGIEINEAYCEISAKRLAQQVLPFAD